MSNEATRTRRGRTRGYKRVALAIVAHEYAYGLDKIKGISNYYRKHSAWEIHRSTLSQPFVMPEELRGWAGDGVIGQIYNEADSRNLRSLGIPVVNTASSGDLATDVPSVAMDNHAIGRMAAEHLVECKLDHFAFIGPAGLTHAQERYEGFSQGLEKAGATCVMLECSHGEAVDSHVSEEELVNPASLQEVLRGLELPIGIMASSDRVGFAVLEACRRLGLRSPEDVAVMGVDDDDIYCNFAYSSMTSIDPDAEKVGFTAAAMLDKLMAGEPLEEQHVLISPKRIVFRNSTDMTRSDYPEVARALRFIRSHADEFIDVTNVLDVVPVSRRWLETKFKEEVGHGIYQEILRIHIERAKELLAATDWPVSRIARESGFANTERIEFAFQKKQGLSTAEYRRQQGIASGS